MMRDYQKTSLHDVALDVRIGILDFERKKKQRIIVDLDLFRFRGAFKGKKIADCLDYDAPFQYITKEWPKRAHTDLIETLAEDLIAFCLKMKGVEAARVAIRKPDIYKGKATPAVAFFRMKSKK